MAYERCNLVRFAAAAVLVTWSAAAGTNDLSWISRLPKVEVGTGPSGATSPGAAGEGWINFSFDQVDVAAFVKLVGELTGKRLVVSEGVKGKITVISPQIKVTDVYPLFVSILESAGCSIVQDGDVYRVVPLPERATLFAPVVGPEEPTPATGIITKVFRLENVSVAELRKLLETKVSGGKLGAVGAIEETNHLVVTDTAENIRRIEKLVAEIDRPGLARMTEVVPLQYIGAEELAEAISAAIAETETRGQQLRRRLPQPPEGGTAVVRQPTVVPSPHANSLILVGTVTQIQQLKRLIQMMDVDAPAGRGRLNAIFLKYMSAEEAAKSLNALISGEVPERPGQTQPKRTLGIQADVGNNALLINATPSEFEMIKKLVDQLDRPQEQVHIEVLIAEVSSGESLDLGVQMAALDMPESVGDLAVQGGLRVKDTSASIMKAVQEGLIPQGLSVGVARGARVDAAGNLVSGYPALLNLDAIRKDSRFKIRSNPSLMAQNNQEASVNIVNQIPILKSTIQGGSGAARDVIQNIERLDVGIKLKLTPSIIPGGKVRMVLNPVIEAVTDQGPQGQYTPTIARREVTTTVTVGDGEMIVIAGLTREDQTKVVKKIPVLGSIPVVGWIFKHTATAIERTNLLIFVTPRIVADAAATARMAETLQQKTGLKADEQP